MLFFVQTPNNEDRKNRLLKKYALVFGCDLQSYERITKFSLNLLIFSLGVSFIVIGSYMPYAVAIQPRGCPSRPSTLSLVFYWPVSVSLSIIALISLIVLIISLYKGSIQLYHSVCREVRDRAAMRRARKIIVDGMRGNRYRVEILIHSLEPFIKEKDKWPRTRKWVIKVMQQAFQNLCTFSVDDVLKEGFKICNPCAYCDGEFDSGELVCDIYNEDMVFLHYECCTSMDINDDRYDDAGREVSALNAINYFKELVDVLAAVCPLWTLQDVRDLTRSYILEQLELVAIGQTLISCNLEGQEGEEEEQGEWHLGHYEIDGENTDPDNHHNQSNDESMDNHEDTSKSEEAVPYTAHNDAVGDMGQKTGQQYTHNGYGGEWILDDDDEEKSELGSEERSVRHSERNGDGTGSREGVYSEDDRAPPTSIEKPKSLLKVHTDHQARMKNYKVIKRILVKSLIRNEMVGWTVRKKRRRRNSKNVEGKEDKSLELFARAET